MGIKFFWTLEGYIIGKKNYQLTAKVCGRARSLSASSKFMHLKKREANAPGAGARGSPAPPRAAQNKLPDEAAARVRDPSRDALPLRSAGVFPRLRAGTPGFAPIFSEKGATALNGVCHASFPLFHPGVSREAAPGAPGAGKTGPFQLALPAAATLDPHRDSTRARVCARRRARGRQAACPRALGTGCMCSQERLSLAACNLESFPLSRRRCPDTPRVQQEAMTSVASLPDSPRAAAAAH